MAPSRNAPVLLTLGVLLSLVASGVSVLLSLRERPRGNDGDEILTPPPPGGPGRTAESAGVEAVLLRERLEGMEGRLRRLETERPRRVAPTTPADPEGAAAVPKEKEKPPAVQAEVIRGFLQDGAYEEFLKQFGEPDKKTQRGNGSLRLHYFEKGIKAEVDRYGKVEWIQFFGKVRSDLRVATGRWVGVYEPGGEWYRPSRFRIDGVSAGMHVTEVFEIWGAADKRNQRADGTEVLVYEGRSVVLKVGEDYRVFEMEFSAK